MRSLLIIAVICTAGVRLSDNRKDQSEEDEKSSLYERVERIEEELRSEKKVLQKKIEEVKTENMVLKRKIEEVIRGNKELQEKIDVVGNPPFGYFCGFQELFSTPNSVINYDKLLYSSQFGLEGESPGINITSGKFLSGFTGTWRVDFSLWTGPDPAEAIYVFLYKNGVRVPETEFASYRSFTGSGYDGNTGGRSVLVHLDLGDELYIGTTTMEEPAVNIIFCVSLEQVDIQKHLL